MTMGERQKVGEVSDEQALPRLPFGAASFSLPNGFTYASKANPPFLNFTIESEIKNIFPPPLGFTSCSLILYLGIKFGVDNYMWITDETLWVDEQSKQEDIEISNNKIQCYSFNKDEIIDFEIISRSNINSKLSGPKIIVESTAITYVDVNYEVSNDSDHNLLIINKEMK